MQWGKIRSAKSFQDFADEKKIPTYENAHLKYQKQISHSENKYGLN
jgi:hypothetical protein